MEISLKYLQHYPAHLQQQIYTMKMQNQLADYFNVRYPKKHNIQTDKSLFIYCNEIKEKFLRNAPVLNKVHFDNRLSLEHHALGLNTAISRVQGGKLTAKKEIRISSFFKESPIEFLRMIVVHELAHLREKDHNKAFYQLCQYMEADYHQLEFDCRAYLYWKSVQEPSENIT